MLSEKNAAINKILTLLETCSLRLKLEYLGNTYNVAIYIPEQPITNKEVAVLLEEFQQFFGYVKMESSSINSLEL